MKLWAAALCSMALLLPNAARAHVERFAVIIGNNSGQPEDPELHCAESDA